jgi:starvation-inducible DNA-binding protein
MKIKIVTTGKERDTSIALLSAILSDEMTLYFKTRKFEWNFSEDGFIELNKFFKKQYVELEETIDLISERINKLGGKAIAIMKGFTKLTRLKESPKMHPAQDEMMKELLNDYEAVIVELKKDITGCTTKNKGISDFLFRILKQHETTTSWLKKYIA